MSKSGPIGKVEAFYIEHHYKHIDVKELADILDRKIDTLKKYIKTNYGDSTTQIRAGEHFAKNKGSIVMTETASMLGDATKKRTVKSHNGCVTKIKHD